MNNGEKPDGLIPIREFGGGYADTDLILKLNPSITFNPED